MILNQYTDSKSWNLNCEMGRREWPSSRERDCFDVGESSFAVLYPEAIAWNFRFFYSGIFNSGIMKVR